MDYSCFDSLLDLVFVLNENKEIVYCNEAAATFCESSIRRLTKNKKIYDVLSFGDESLFTMPEGTWGRDQATPYTEVDVTLKSTNREGKIQLAIQPFQEGEAKRWVVMVRDVTLEEVLAGKYRAQLEEKEIYIEELKRAQGELEQYSKNLEGMVQERTAEVRAANQMLQAIMNSLGQGFLTFDQEGKCSDIYTKACLDILEKEPGGKNITEVLNLDGSDLDQFKMWCKAVFSESLPLESLIELAPHFYSHSQGKMITLDYFPIRQSGNGLSQLVLVATDKTSEHEASIALENEKEHARMILKIFKGRDQFSHFLESTRSAIQAVKEQVEMARFHGFDADEAFRRLHTMEGEAGAFSATTLKDGARESQSSLEPLRSGSKDLSDSKALEQFAQAVEKLTTIFEDFCRENDEIFQVLGIGSQTKIEVPKAEICLLLERMRYAGVREEEMAPLYDRYLKNSLSSLLEHYNNVIQVVAERQQKKVKPIRFVGGNVRVSPDAFQDLFGSFVHVFRNAVDHGIEEPEARLMSEKSEEGEILIHARRKTLSGCGWLELVIQDDGGGIDPNIIRQKIHKMLPDVEVDNLSDEEVLQYIFHPGLSSREEVGEFSGRGVGMDAVKTEVLNMGGKIHVSSELGRGTCLTLLVPEAKVELDLVKCA
jgi:two-component system chemotaxis sensor kinase CheA